MCGAGDLFAPHALCDLVTAAPGRRGRRLRRRGPLRPGPRAPRRPPEARAVRPRDPLLLRRRRRAARRAHHPLQGARGARRHDRAPVAAHDFALRLAERTESIAHVAEVLLSRPGLAPDPFDATAATIPVVARRSRRIGATATVGAGEVLPSVRYTVAPPSPAPSVAIVIPTRDRLDLLRRASTRSSAARPIPTTRS